MSDKSGGDVFQANAGIQGNLSSQDVNSVAAAGAGVVDGIGGSAVSGALGAQTVSQNQNQGNAASTGSGGNDNVNAGTNLNV